MKTNTAIKTPAPKTHEGATAARINPEQQLRRVVLASMLFEDTFYLDGVSSAQIVEDSVQEVLKKKNGPQIVSDLAYETRTNGKLRHIPLFLALTLVRAGNKNTKLGEECRAVVAETLTKIIQRPDELAEFLALYWKDKKVPLSNQVKKGLAAAFQKFDRYSLSKYANREGSISLRDVLFLVHPRPLNSDQQELWNELAEKKLVAPDTWESNLSAGADKKETFIRLIEEKKLGALALLRNLRNMQQAGVPDDTIRKALSEMKTERVLPFRYISAANYAPQLEPELEQAMYRSLKDHEKLSGKTVLLVDNSGSMGSPVSGRSQISRADAAQALAMLVREISETSEVIVFGTTAGSIPPRRGFALRDAVRHSQHGGGTNTEVAKKLADKVGYDRLIIFTDEQSHQALSAPKEGSKAYVINVAAYQNGVGYGKWVHIDGFSEAAVDFIQQYEKEKNELA